MTDFTEKDAEETLQKGYKKAEKILNDKNKMDEFLERLEKKLKLIPLAGTTLAMIPTLVQMLKSCTSILVSANRYNSRYNTRSRLSR